MSAARIAAVLLLGLTACANGTSVTPSSGAGGAGGGGTTTGAGGGGRSGDALPSGAISFVDAKSCPDGWAPFAPGDGRVFLPTLGNAAAGTKYGDPLSSGEDRPHTHGVSGSFNVPAVSFAGIAGGGNHGVAAAGVVMLAATSGPASTGLPYVQLLACKKAAPPVPRQTPLPSGMALFFDTPTCPAGWAQTEVTQGRFVVGLPKGAPPDLSFGGGVLSGAGGRPHAHPMTATLKTESHGIALASGCCADGYGASGSYDSTAASGESEVDLPYIELLHCQVP